MKGFRGTWIWALVVALLGGYTLWDWRQNRERGDLQSGERLAFSLKRDEISHIVFERGGVKVVLDRQNDEWHMTSPVDDFAEDSTIDGFLFSIMGEKLRTFRDESGEPDWKTFGLAPPGVTIELGSASKSEKIEVSTTNAFNGSYYVRQGNEVLAGATSLAQSTDRTIGSFRSRRIWRHADAEVSRVRMEMGSSSFTLDKAGGNWKMTPEPKFALDPERVSKWVDGVEDLTATDFVRQGTSEGLGEWGLDKPRAKISIDYKAPSATAGQWVLSLGPEKGSDVFFFTNDRDTVVKTAAASVRKVLISPEYFRDGHEPFRFDAEAAREIRVRTPKISLVARKNGAEWALVGGRQDARLNESEFKDFLGSLGALRAADFSGSAIAVKSKPSVEIVDGGGHALLSLWFGNDYKSKAIWNSGAELRAVSTGRGQTLGLPKGQIDTLIKENLITDKTPAAPAPPKASEAPHK